MSDSYMSFVPLCTGQTNGDVCVSYTAGSTTRGTTTVGGGGGGSGGGGGGGTVAYATPVQGVTGHQVDSVHADTLRFHVATRHQLQAQDVRRGCGGRGGATG